MPPRKSPLVGSHPAPVSSLPPISSENDMCPVCKTLRYLNKDMVFLINPECYHPMCSTCVARLFAGPNQCPYAGCSKTLRRKDFRSAFFEDLGVEREVDIRRRVHSVFNKCEDDFDELDAYNEYLEMVETLSMDLVYGDAVSKAAVEERLRMWEAQHRAEIDKNRRRGERAAEAGRARIEAEREAAISSRDRARQEEMEERLQKERERAADIEALARAPEGTGGKVMLKRRGQHMREELAASEEAALRRAAGAAGLSIRGLKEKKGLDTGPYDPFGGVKMELDRCVLQDDYINPFLKAVRERESLLAGGYDIQEYYARAMWEAFSGLAVFVDDEKETGQGTTAASVATIGAGIAADMPLKKIKTEPGIKMEVDDVF